jgi:hypothetical protein
VLFLVSIYAWVNLGEMSPEAKAMAEVRSYIYIDKAFFKECVAGNRRGFRETGRNP